MNVLFLLAFNAASVHSGEWLPTSTECYGWQTTPLCHSDTANIATADSDAYVTRICLNHGGVEKNEINAIESVVWSDGSSYDTVIGDTTKEGSTSECTPLLSNGECVTAVYVSFGSRIDALQFITNGGDSIPSSDAYGGAATGNEGTALTASGSADTCLSRLKVSAVITPGNGLSIRQIAFYFQVTAEPTSSPTRNPTSTPTAAPTNYPSTTPTTAAPTTAAPTTAAPSTAEPTTTRPTTASPTTPAPTTAAPTTAAPTTAVPTTAAPTTAAPSTAEPTTTRPTTASPTTPAPTTASPTTVESETTHAATTAWSRCNDCITYNNYTVTVTIRTDSLSTTEILFAIANAFNLSSTPLTITTVSSDDGFATVELLVAVSSNTELYYDVIKATLKEAMVDEYGEDIQVDIDVHSDDDDDEGDEETQEQTQEQSAPDLDWLINVALCIAGVGFCFAVAGVIKCILAKRRQSDIGNLNQVQAAQIELSERPRQLSAAAAGVEPGAGEPDLELGQSVSNRVGLLRASVAAQIAAVTAGMIEDEFDVADDHQTDAGYSANFVRAEAIPAGMEVDEFEVRLE